MRNRRPNLRILRLLLIALIIHNLLLVSTLPIVSLRVDRWALRCLILSRSSYRIICILTMIVVLGRCLNRRRSRYLMLWYRWIVMISLIGASTIAGNISNTFLIMTIGSLQLYSLNLFLQHNFFLLQNRYFLLCLSLFVYDRLKIVFDIIVQLFHLCFKLI